MHFSSLAIATFAVAAHARPVEDTLKAVVLPPVHQNAAREALLDERATTSIPLPTAGDDSLYIKYALDHHNKHRSNHTFNGKATSPMQWNATTARTAKEVADLCIFAHKMDVEGGGYGQNLAAGYKAANITGTITDLWYNSEVAAYAGLYGQAQPSYSDFGAWGHFSQLVWNASTSVGCWTTNCSATGLSGVGSSVPPYLTVCNYYPAGNYGGQYAKNVGTAQGQPRLPWNWVSS
ncbi:hypothetical protein DOTSEDRAFT_54921 [Dothistroma septosporum NZE10]|uniref:SCP domain-containing protein n=1 Tax=Dothistroma septosporum (strain NZE10 / CBS 128990) TaxID=675120 RepID=N1PJL9_DOTSN|nr:hypothetical protein DOTSEDRAFT_54921 [Dothistroma septosporum NZE10]